MLSANSFTESFHRYITSLNVPADGQTVSKGQKYVAETLTIIELKGDSDHQDLSKEQSNAIEWANRLDNPLIYIDICKSIETNGKVRLDQGSFLACHSLSLNTNTWLLGSHQEFGSVYLLQSNYSLEAILFNDLSLYAICRNGIDQLNSLGSLIGQCEWPHHREWLAHYLTTSPKFAGFNQTFPSPFHNIVFGHTGLLQVYYANICLRAPAYILSKHAWFDPSRLFPTVIQKTVEISHSSSFLECLCDHPVFHVKIAHVYRTAAAENLWLDSTLLSSSVSLHQPPSNTEFSLWIGLTSGKRSLLNECDIIIALLSQLNILHRVNTVFIDGWTGSSTESSIMQAEAPVLYESHNNEFLNISTALSREFPGIIVNSMIGLSYEQKVSICCSCNFSFTSAYTASIVPSRFCGIPGVIHSSNAGLPFLNMHIWKSSSFVPPSCITDVSSQDTRLDPLDSSYKIDLAAFNTWIKPILRSLYNEDPHCDS